MVKADLLIVNANIMTLDKYNTVAKSAAVKDGHIIGIWQDAKPPRDDVDYSLDQHILDLKGKTIIPGFIDTHNHLLMYSLFRKQANCSTPPNKSIADILDRIKKQANETPEGKWVLGWGYDNTLLEEKRHPTRRELDAAVPDKPVLIRHISAHFAVANSAALRIAGVDEQTPDPQGGHLGRDENGRLDGVLHELPALDLVQAAIPPLTAEEIAACIGEGSQDYLAQGITTNSDAGVGLDYGAVELDAHLLALKKGLNPLNMRLMVLHFLLNENGPFKDYSAEELNHEIQRRSLNRARLDSAKLFQDGSIQGLTGALRDPYHCAPEIIGELLHDQDSFNEEILNLHNRGFRVTIHGNGDRAIGSIIEAYAHALEASPRSNHRHRIEHVQTATNEDLDRMSELGIAASFFINHVYYWGDRHRRLFLGPERAERINPLRDAQKRNILFTLHSDCPITPISPLFSVWAAVNRVTREGMVLGEDQRINVIDALKTMTIDGARLNFEENERGTIEIGKKADFAILESDPTAVDPMEIKDIPVLATLINGEIKYMAPNQSLISV
ncbi:amidohydrolase [Neobacillus mesonae]|uniref:amidohydrolase n=1 Tax=Neobacillus mesonae TaxID=1193713 RepID=UPI00203BE8E7|nr:amidohydrolase [Neobacillus mesonae]MCM3568453.1 amidohydrolase [Neobacillus mesonae]